MKMQNCHVYHCIYKSVGGRRDTSEIQPLESAVELGSLHKSADTVLSDVADCGEVTKQSHDS